MSIVVPTFNDDPMHLRESIGSALGQTYARLEVIVVDDGSTRPDTVAQIDRWAGDGRVRVLRQSNAGAAAARNAGLAVARGTYAMVLDGDDRIDRTYVEACVNQMRPGVAFVYYENLDFFWDDGRVQHQPPTPASWNLAGFMDMNRIAAVALFRLADWAAVGGFVEDPPSVFEDYHFWVDLLSSADNLVAVQAPGTLLEYRQREGSRRSHKPPRERRALTRSSLASTSDLEVLRRLFLAAGTRMDELGLQSSATKAPATWRSKARATIRNAVGQRHAKR